MSKVNIEKAQTALTVLNKHFEDKIKFDEEIRLLNHMSKEQWAIEKEFSDARSAKDELDMKPFKEIQQKTLTRLLKLEAKALKSEFYTAEYKGVDYDIGDISSACSLLRETTVAGVIPISDILAMVKKENKDRESFLNSYGVRSYSMGNKDQNDYLYCGETFK